MLQRRTEVLRRCRPANHCLRAAAVDTSPVETQEIDGSYRSYLSDRGNRVPALKESDRRGQNTGPQISKQYIRHKKEDSGTQTSLGPEKVEYAHGTEGFQNLDSEVDIPKDQNSFNDLPSWKPYATKATRTEKQRAINYETMVINSNPDGSRNQEFSNLERAADEIEWLVIPAGKSRAGEIIRFQLRLLGCCSRIQVLLGNMESIGDIDTYLCQRNFDDYICIAYQECNRTIRSGLFGQHDDP
ncbi:hypothetical protein AYI69_g216 [Smittium culicis]|uniref:Uncharacterized protein n=1 Tax=Smittium culicis TaxID=133412 RepID=A0A1R1YTM7_9FUNG|nr:hypothetical protein AYI69_g216 [Smittium culicis]